MQPIVHIRKCKVVSIRSINSSPTWQIKNSDDVNRYIDELRKNLMNALEEGTTLNVEF